VTYSDLTLHYFLGALRARSTESPQLLTGPGVHRGAAGSRKQGIWVQFDVQVVAGMIRAARFLAFGCPHTIAVSAWVVEQAIGQAVRPALPETVARLCERFALPVEKRGRLLTIEEAWTSAVAACGGTPGVADGLPQRPLS
jgi:NifU-like protein involved in Fe-S cluster formation